MGPRAATLILVVLAALVAAAPAGAATFTVSDGASNSGPGTLRQAITDANADSGSPTIRFTTATVSVTTALPEITKTGTFVDGCNVGRNGLGTPNAPAITAPCATITGPGSASFAGLVVKDASGVRIQNVRIGGFAVGIRLWGASSSLVAGNVLGVTAAGGSSANGRAIQVVARASGGNLVTAATGNVIGGDSDATSDPPDCAGYCNLIGNSTVAGIDLNGGGSDDLPAGGDDGDLSMGTMVRGNWIGVRTAAGAVVPNAVAVSIGNAHETTLQQNVVSGNTVGVDQGTGTTATSLVGGIFGMSPDQNTTVGNGTFQVRLHGSLGTSAYIENATFGPAPVGLQLDGAGAEVYGTSFRAPTPESPDRFTTAAIRLGPDADKSWIGSTNQLLGSLPAGGCILLIFPLDGCTAIGAVGPNGYGILVQGADQLTIRRTGIGGTMSGSGPIEGVPVRFENGTGSDPVQGALVGIEASQGWNDFARQTGPAVQVDGGATGVTIGGNGGIASTSFNAVASRFTDLLPPAGPGNTTANGGVQPPVVTQATVNGIAGTATPGATIRVIQQQRTADAETVPADPIEGYTYPVDEQITTANGAGVWGITFAAPINAGQKLFASQTVNGSTSEFASPQDATTEDPDPIAQITSGPTGLISATSATFTFVADTPGSTFQCSLDGADFTACTSPKDYAGLEPGGHQFRVRAIDPLNTIGPPASRAWTIELPAPTTAPGTKTPLGTGGSGGSGGTGSDGVAASAAVPLASVVTLPSAKRCVSRRALRIRLKAPKGTGIAFAKIDVPGRATKTVRGKAISAPVNLRGLPKGRFTVRLRVTLLDGRVVKGSRTFRTCAAKKKR